MAAVALSAAVAAPACAGRLDSSRIRRPEGETRLFDHPPAINKADEGSGRADPRPADDVSARTDASSPFTVSRCDDRPAFTALRTRDTPRGARFPDGGSTSSRIAPRPTSHLACFVARARSGSTPATRARGQFSPNRPGRAMQRCRLFPNLPRPDQARASPSRGPVLSSCPPAGAPSAWRARSRLRPRTTAGGAS